MIFGLNFNTISEKRKILKNSKDIVHYLSVELGERTLRKYDNLNKARQYIIDFFRKEGKIPVEEKYIVNKKEVANIIVDVKGSEYPDDIILVAAHYDTIEDTPGADDNASAIAALLEIYRLLSKFQFKKTIRFVAFTLEEPPYFLTNLMGSVKYASQCKKRKENIELMISFDMLGYGGKKCKQKFPIQDMEKNFPKCGNYLTVVSFPSVAEYVYLWKGIYNKHSKNKIYEIVGPASIPGIDLSDHTPFVRNGYPGILLTDTAFYRNENYHCPTDTYDTINFKFLTENIWSIFLTFNELLNMEEIRKGIR